MKTKHISGRNPNYRPQKLGVIQNFDDFAFEAGMLPDLSSPPIFRLTPLEHHFMEIADKHGVIDQMLDDMDYEDYE